MESTEGLVQGLLSLPVFRSEWVLWLLLGLSLLSVAVMVERWVFYRRRKLDFDSVKNDFGKALDAGDFDAAAKVLAKHDTLETNVTLAGLRGYDKGPESVEELIAGAMSRGKVEYERRLSILATLASNCTLHRPVRHRARHRALVQGDVEGHRQRQRGRHGRHRRGPDRDRGGPLGRDSRGGGLQRLQGHGEGLGDQHRVPDPRAHGRAQVGRQEGVGHGRGAKRQRR